MIRIQNSSKKLYAWEDCPSYDLPSNVKKRAWFRGINKIKIPPTLCSVFTQNSSNTGQASLETFGNANLKKEVHTFPFLFVPFSLRKSFSDFNVPIKVFRAKNKEVA